MFVQERSSVSGSTRTLFQQSCRFVAAPCCPRSLFHLSCLASLTPVDGRVCPACPEDVRSGVMRIGSSGSATSMVLSSRKWWMWSCTVCEEGMTVDSSIEVPVVTSATCHLPRSFLFFSWIAVDCRVRQVFLFLGIISLSWLSCGF